MTTKRNESKKGVKKSNKPFTLSCHEFDIRNVSFTEFDKEKNVKTKQNNVFPRYSVGEGHTEDIVIKTEPIELVGSGVSGWTEFTKQYYKTDRELCKVKIPFDPSQKACVDLMRVINDIDKYMEGCGYEKFFPKVDKKGKAQYAYTKLYKEPSDSGDSKFPRYASMRAAFDLVFDDSPNAPIVFNTTFYVRDKDTQKPEPREFKTIDELAKVLGMGAKARFILRFSKVWGAKSASKNSIDYGMKVTCLQVEIIEESQPRTRNKDLFKKQCVFDDDEEETEPETRADKKGDEKELVAVPKEPEKPTTDTNSESGDEKKSESDHSDAEEKQEQTRKTRAPARRRNN